MAMSLSFLVCFVLLIANLLSAEPEKQYPLIPIGNGEEAKEIDLIYELKKAEIIPTVFDSFHPELTISVDWKDATAEYGNTVNPADTQDMPTIKLIDQSPDARSHAPAIQLTLALSDPDAPSRDNPEWSEVCHWIATSIPLTSSHDSNVEVSELEEVMPWKPPGPPPKTGKHRYVFVALSPLNGTTETLHLRKPAERHRWGYEHERYGLRQWADEMGLGVVGANFIYAQNDEQ